MLSFKLVQRLYDAGFPYPWITWEGKLWEDPDNQPGLGELVRACALMSDSFHLQKGKENWWVCTTGFTIPENGSNPEIASALYWLALPKPNQPRHADHVDMPVDLKN